MSPDFVEGAFSMFLIYRKINPFQDQDIANENTQKQSLLRPVLMRAIKN